jgi:RNA polymerase-binding transcription factor DksA
MKKDVLKFPRNIVEPIRLFLEREIVKLKRTKNKLKKNDPFANESRTEENSLEEDVDEQIGHFDSQVKAKFVDKQIVQLRKALTMIKLGKYGICEKCGKMINTDRLAVKPDVTICIKCEREREI